MDIVNEIMSHPEIFPLISDDGTPNEVSLNDSDLIYYLYGNEGIVVYSPISSITYETHWCILPEYWGKSTNFIKESIQWMFNNTECLKIEGRIPEYNRRAYVHAKKIGFKDQGNSENSIMKHGKIFDMKIVGLEKWGV